MAVPCLSAIGGTRPELPLAFPESEPTRLARSLSHRNAGNGERFQRSSLSLSLGCLLQDCRNAFNYASDEEDGSTDGKRKGDPRRRAFET
jgi:hypothetical protein